MYFSCDFITFDFLVYTIFMFIEKKMFQNVGISFEDKFDNLGEKLKIIKLLGA